MPFTKTLHLVNIVALAKKVFHETLSKNSAFFILFGDKKRLQNECVPGGKNNTFYQEKSLYDTGFFPTISL